VSSKKLTQDMVVRNRVEPKFSVDARAYVFKNQADKDHFRNGLRRAGLK
jgi:hypothetical protein